MDAQADLSLRCAHMPFCWILEEDPKQYEPPHDKTNKMTVRPAKDQPGHPPSLIRVFAVRLMGS